MREVEFTKDFGGCKKGDVNKYDGMLANQLVNVDKVAKYTPGTQKSIDDMVKKASAQAKREADARKKREKAAADAKAKAIKEAEKEQKKAQKAEN